MYVISRTNLRLWSIHPSYLDPVGLVALWREGLLAKKVLQGKTRGYKHHPQLERFRSHGSPVGSINSYLRSVWIEADRRGYSFDKKKLGSSRKVFLIPVNSGQIVFELTHLRRKLKTRNKKCVRSLIRVSHPKPHPQFKIRNGPVEPWEKG